MDFKKEKYYYALDNNFSTMNNDVPDEFVNKIICGDSAEVLKKLPENSIDIIITSPPYNFGREYDVVDDNLEWNTYFNKLFNVFDGCIRVLKYGGRMVINIQPIYSYYIPTHHIISNYLMQKKLIWKGEFIWDKTVFSSIHNTFGTWLSPRSPYLKSTLEYIEVFSKGNLSKDGNKEDIDITKKEFMDWTLTLWTIRGVSDMNKWKHPAVFPEEIPYRIIKLFSYKNDIVLDPFNGVGTTTVVAQQLKRRFLGIDISEQYCETAKKRLKYFQNSMFD